MPLYNVSYGSRFKVRSSMDNNGYAPIMAVGKSSYYPYSLFYLASTKKVGCLMRISASNRFLYSDQTFELPSDWIHAICTYDGSKMRMYINGEFESEATYAGYLTYNTSNTLYL